MNVKKLTATLAAAVVLTLAAPVAAADAAPVRDRSVIAGSTIRKCVTTTYRAAVWHTHKTRAGEKCLWLGYWYPKTWVVLDQPAYYAGMWWPVMQAPPRGGWHGHQPADAAWWPGRASALQ